MQSIASFKVILFSMLYTYITITIIDNNLFCIIPQVKDHIAGLKLQNGQFFLSQLVM
jgi:hypothetical protein